MSVIGLDQGHFMAAWIQEENVVCRLKTYFMFLLKTELNSGIIMNLEFIFIFHEHVLKKLDGCILKLLPLCNESFSVAINDYLSTKRLIKILREPKQGNCDLMDKTQKCVDKLFLVT